MSSGRTAASAHTRGAESFDRRLIAPMMLGSILNPINSSIIAVSLIPIGVAFGAPPAQTAWLVSALYLATSIGQPVVGRLVDTFGPRPLFLVGSTLVGLAGILGTLAPSLGVLVCARVLLGFGTCAGYPAAMHLIRSEARRTGRDSPAGILTTLAVATQTVAVIGPSLGGLLIGLGGWRTTFAINVPLAAASLFLGARRLPRRGPDHRPGAQAVRYDLAGMGLFAAMLVTLLLFLMHPGLREGYLLAIGAAIVVSALTGRRTQVRGKLLVGAATQVLVCALLLMVDAGSGIWLLAVLAVIMGVPQGLNNLATQNAVYAQADPDRIGSSAGLLRTFLYLGAITASAAGGAFFPHRASTSGLHHLAVFMLACATAFLLVTALDRSLARVGARSRTANRLSARYHPKDPSPCP